MSLKSRNVYIISDGTGETASAMVRAALVQYHHQDLQIIRNKNVRTENQIEALIDEAFQNQGMIVYTVASPSLRNKIREMTGAKAIPSVDLLGPLLNEFDRYFGVTSSDPQAGLLRKVDDRYFKRIEAIEYTVKHDDGKCLTDLNQADVILVGLSRTSKTPLSIFLSHKGWKVANIPLVLNTPPPEELKTADQRKIVALIIGAENLHRIRRKRLEKFGQDPGSEYGQISYIQKEIEHALSIYRQNKRWPVLDVTDRALEETATEIIRIVSARTGQSEDILF